jgi:AAA family ATP:ADP antiporter
MLFYLPLRLLFLVGFLGINSLKIFNFQLLWGDMSQDELKRFGILSATYFFLIGAYWLIRVMKDPIFEILVGFRYQPFAKMVSLVVVICAVLFYNKLIDLLKRDKLFFGSTYSNFIPGNILGWIAYCFIEIFGSLMPALFLSIVVSTMSVESAKKGYGMIFTFAQIGAILGTLLVMFYLKNTPVAPSEKIEAAEHKPEKTGILEGLKLLISRPYVAGLFVVTTTYEVIGTIVEFQMKITATQIYPKALDGGIGFGWFTAVNGTMVNVLALTFALFGTSFFMRKFGLKFCVISFPTMIGIAVASIFGFYMAGVSAYFLMWALFVAVVLFKGLSYTLNNPSREVLYIPTSKDVKFKSKSFIEAFGGRSTKAIGATVTGSLGGDFAMLLVFGTFISLGVVAFWIFVAAFVGNKFNELQKENKIIE